MYTELMLKITQQQWQPIEAYPVLFWLMKYPSTSLVRRSVASNELSTNIIYKN
jgi:hypothetical protein